MILFKTGLVQAALELVLEGAAVLDGGGSPIVQRDPLIVLPDELTAHQGVAHPLLKAPRVLLPVRAKDPFEVFFDVGRVAERFDILFYSTPNTGKDICAQTLSLRLVFHLLNLIEEFIAACAKHTALLRELLRCRHANNKWGNNRLSDH